MKLFELFATLSLNAQNFVNGVNKVGKQAQGFATNIQHRMSAAPVAIGNLTARGIAKVADTGAKMVKDSLNVVKEFEQNLGGSEAVFGEWASNVQSVGQKAFKNLGLSTSDYLATANKMGSLFKGAGYTTGEAMDMTTKAMQRAADVASIMGVDAEWAMESIAGLAKGNFTMMDNLGVAINDTTLANYALEKGIKKSVRAMSTQEKIGLALELFMERTASYAGNYAKENTTLAGSYEVLGAAYENMLIGQEGATDDFVDALGVAAKATMKNLGEIVPRLWNSMHQGIQRAAPRVKEAFVNLWDNDLPTLATNAANGLITTINDVFGTNIPTIGSIDFPTWEEIETSFSTWWTTTKANIQSATKWVLNAFENPVETGEQIRESISTWWTNTALPAIKEASQWALSLFGVPVEDNATILEHVSAWWNTIVGVVQSAASWTLQLFGVPTDTAEAITNTIAEWWKGVVNLVIAACSWALGLPTPPNAAETIKKIQSWWQGVAKNLNLTAFFGVEAEGLGSEVRYSSSGEAHGGGVQRFPASQRVGLDYVPYDNYLSNLHEGEAVLTKSEAEQWRRGASNVAERIDYGKMAEAVAVAMAGMSVQMDGVTVGHMVSPTVSRDIAQNAKSRRYG